MTLQRRVLAYLALAAVASCVLTVVVGAVLVRNRIAAGRVTALRNQANVLELAGTAPGVLNPGTHVYRVGGGRPVRIRLALRAAVLAAIPASPDAAGTVTIANRSFLYVARPTPNGRIVLIRVAALAFAEWRPFLGSLILAGLGGALLALLLSYLLARRLTRPIDQLAAATRRLAAGEAAVSVAIGGEDELAQLGRAFNEMSGELARARDAQRQFLESVSHELKTPLTSIRGYAEALEEGAVGPQDGARVITDEAGRLQRLVADLLELARFGRAGFQVAHEPLELGQIAEQVVQRHARRAGELGVELRRTGARVGAAEATDATGAVGVWAIGDADRLLQAASNLVENALRLTPRGGSVTVSAAPGEIAVRDSGPGLAAEDLPLAFERFYLHRRYTSERAVGSGLGLAIVKELLEAMGGSVEAANHPGAGVEFRLTLPTDPDRRHLS